MKCRSWALYEPLRRMSELQARVCPTFTTWAPASAIVRSQVQTSTWLLSDSLAKLLGRKR